jgi:hypothetical protein
MKKGLCLTNFNLLKQITFNKCHFKFIISVRWSGRQKKPSHATACINLFSSQYAKRLHCFRFYTAKDLNNRLEAKLRKRRKQGLQNSARFLTNLQGNRSENWNPTWRTTASHLGTTLPGPSTNWRVKLGNGFLSQSNPVITTSVYATPRI